MKIRQVYARRTYVQSIHTHTQREISLAGREDGRTGEEGGRLSIFRSSVARLGQQLRPRGCRVLSEVQRGTEASKPYNEVHVGIVACHASTRRGRETRICAGWSVETAGTIAALACYPRPDQSSERRRAELVRGSIRPVGFPPRFRQIFTLARARRVLQINRLADS